MSTAANRPCSRTAAVLAVHLDGDVDRDVNCGDVGYGFVSSDSLQDHLRDCSTCLSALRRARRLDAVLASSAGRAVADHVAARGIAMPELADRWLRRAAEQARDPAPPLPGPEVEPALVSDTTGPVEASRGWSFAATIGLIAAAVATWLCLTPIDNAPGRTVDVGLSPGTTERGPQSTGAHVVASAPTPPQPTVDATAIEAATIPLALASQLRAARARELPEQRSLSIDELAVRMADARRALPDRLAAARQLLAAARGRSVAAQRATEVLLATLAGCGDQSADEITLHDDVLDRLRNSPPLLATIEARLTAVLLASRQRGPRPEPGDPTLDVVSTVAVAARIGNDRLDAALRRAIRPDQALGDVVAAALRCGARVEGSAALLLSAWHDQVALGRQDDSPRWAEFWFHGQARATFAEVTTALAKARSSPERVRCLLALGCSSDEAAIDLLLANLDSGRQAEAHAAACGLAAMPHRLLRQLLPLAQQADNALLRAALARAGLPEAGTWILLLQLSPPQQLLLRSASLSRFPEVAAWFRNRPTATD